MRSFRNYFQSWNPVLLLKTRFPGNGDHPDLHAAPAWRALYVAAIFETDEERLVHRIAETKKAMVVRAHELFQKAGDHLQEQSAIEEAFQTLRALEQCIVSSVASKSAAVRKVTELRLSGSA